MPQLVTEFEQFYSAEFPVDSEDEELAVVYSEPMPVGAEVVRLSMNLKIDGEVTVNVTLQGSRIKSNDDENWVDTAFLAEDLSGGSNGQFAPDGSDGTVFVAFPFYRMKVEATDGSGVVQFQLAKLRG